MLTVATFSKPEEAHMLRLRLEAGGVPAFIQDENMVQMEGPSPASKLNLWG